MRTVALTIIILWSVQVYGQWTNITPSTNSQWYNATHFVDKDYGFVVGRYWNGHPAGVILKTTDGGSNWNVNYTDSIWELWSVFFIDKSAGFIGTGDGEGKLYKTIDGGATWQLLYTQMAGNIQAIYFQNADTGFFLADTALYRTNDGGLNWTVQLSNNYSMQSMKFIDHQIGFIFGCLPNEFIGPPYYAIILKTIDGGVTWTETSISSQNCLSAISFPTYSKGFTGGGGSGGLFANTVDTGNTWNQINISGGYEIQGLFFTDTMTGYATGSTNHVLIIKTTNGGNTWNNDVIDTAPYGHYIRQIYFPADSIGYAVGGYSGGLIMKKDIETFVQESNMLEHCFILKTASIESSNKLKIKVENRNSKTILLKLYNSIGQVILSSSLDNFNTSKEIDISGIAKGLYFLCLQSECNKETRRIVVE